MKLNANFVFFVLIVVAAETSAADKGDGELLKVLAKERKEMSNIFQQENAELRRDDQKLRERDEKLHDRIDKMAEQMSKQNEQMGKQISKQNEQISKLHGKNDKLQNRNKKLEQQINKLHQKLQRQADPQISPLHGSLMKTVREKDQNGTSGNVDTLKIMTELKQFVKSEIKEFLMNERICVSGKIGGRDSGSNRVTTTHHVNFGYEFPRKPAFSVAISYYRDYYAVYFWKEVEATVSEVTNSSAKIAVRKKDVWWSVSWIACL